jgi:hypothetical protein
VQPDLAGASWLDREVLRDGYFVQQEVNMAGMIGMMVIEKVIRENTPIERDGDKSIGQLMDEQLRELAKNGQEVRTLRVEFEERDWHEYARAILQHEDNVALRPRPAKAVTR